MKNNKGFTLVEVLIAIVLAGYLSTMVFSLIVKLNVAVIKADKVLRQIEQSQLVCTPSENGHSGIYKCVSGKKALK